MTPSSSPVAEPRKGRQITRSQQVSLGLILLLVLSFVPTGTTLVEIIDKVGLARFVWGVTPLMLLPLSFVLLYRLVEPLPGDGARRAARKRAK